MANKKKRRKTSLLTKAINMGILALAFSPALDAVLRGDPGFLPALYTAGIVRRKGQGSFNKQLAVQAYGPIVAAIVLKKAISMVRRTARV